MILDVLVISFSLVSIKASLPPALMSLTLTSDLDKSHLLVGIKALPELFRKAPESESMRASVVMLCNTLYDSIVQ